MNRKEKDSYTIKMLNGITECVIRMYEEKKLLDFLERNYPLSSREYTRGEKHLKDLREELELKCGEYYLIGNNGIMCSWVQDKFREHLKKEHLEREENEQLGSYVGDNFLHNIVSMFEVIGNDWTRDFRVDMEAKVYHRIYRGWYQQKVLSRWWNE